MAPLTGSGRNSMEPSSSGTSDGRLECWSLLFESRTSHLAVLRMMFLGVHQVVQAILDCFGQVLL